MATLAGLPCGDLHWSATVLRPTACTPAAQAEPARVPASLVRASGRGRGAEALGLSQVTCFPLARVSAPGGR